MRCRSASGIFQCNAVFNCRIWRFVHLTIRPLRSRWPDGITKFRSPAAPNYRKLPDSISAGSGITALFVRSPTQFDEAKLGAEEVERRIEVAHAQHGVEISHGEPFLRRWAGRQRFPGETVFAPAAGQRISDHEQAVHLVNSASSHLIGSPLARYS